MARKEEARILEDEEIEWGKGNIYNYEWLLMQQLQRVARFLSEAWFNKLNMGEFKSAESALDVIVGLFKPYLLKEKGEKTLKEINRIKGQLKELNYRIREDRREKGFELLLEYLDAVSIFLEKLGYYKKEIRDLE